MPITCWNLQTVPDLHSSSLQLSCIFYISSFPFLISFISFSYFFISLFHSLCGLEAEVPGYRSRGFQFDSRCYQIFWQVLGLERGSLSLMSTSRELLRRNSSGSGLENRDYEYRDQPCWPSDTLYPQKMALTSPTKSGLSVGAVRSRPDSTEFLVSF
jgi:hypothetical protein